MRAGRVRESGVLAERGPCAVERWAAVWDGVATRGRWEGWAEPNAGERGRAGCGPGWEAKRADWRARGKKKVGPQGLVCWARERVELGLALGRAAWVGKGAGWAATGFGLGFFFYFFFSSISNSNKV